MIKTVKNRIAFVCQQCGATSAKWVGKCSDCGSWNSFVEESVEERARVRRVAHVNDPVLLSDVVSSDEERISVSVGELDRVLGGGLVKGSVVLIGGDPGIGKSTVCLQMSRGLASTGKKVLYISGEESVRQMKLRADRLGLKNDKNLYIANTTDLDAIIQFIKKFVPDVVIVDSIQVVYSSSLPSSAGSVGRVRECANILTQLAKSTGISLFLIGHVTKDGTLAGPRVLEHIVDTVLYFEGERFSQYRLLRAFKNRFGSTNEIGVFSMDSRGLREVSNPSEIFLTRSTSNESGRVVVPVIEGSRPILVEIQALCARSGSGILRRRAHGIDSNRVSLLSAVLEKRLSVKLFDKDIFVNVVGGVKIVDPAVDLAVCLAIASSALNRGIQSDTVVIGEVGLASEVRGVSQMDKRLNEVKRLGFKRCVIAESDKVSARNLEATGLEICAVHDLKGAFRSLWGEPR